MRNVVDIQNRKLKHVFIFSQKDPRNNLMEAGWSCAAALNPTPAAIEACSPQPSCDSVTE